MVLTCYLAMTATEFAGAEALPPHPAWMACHFSPYGTGLSNCPEDFPKGGMLILNDRTPVDGHDPALIASQLAQLVREFSPEAVLLDFQRPGEERTAAIVKTVTEALSCPVGVSAQYAPTLGCPVFLPLPPPHKPLKEYLAPWAGRDLWLEIGLTGEEIRVTDKGSFFLPLSKDAAPLHADRTLHCHYCVDVTEQEARFTLLRTGEDLFGLLREAEALGVRLAVGLYQELGTLFPAASEDPKDT